MQVSQIESKRSSLRNGTKKLKVAKALKLKNQIAGEVSELKTLLQLQNVRSTGQSFDYDNPKVLARLRRKIDELVAVKAAIALANTAVYGQIFRLAELKGLVATLTELDTKSGVHRESGPMGGVVEVRYRVQLSKVDIDRLVARLKDEINDLQDSLDQFNAAHCVEV